MTKPRLVKVEALFYVFQQVMQGGRAMNFDTPPYRGGPTWETHYFLYPKNQIFIRTSFRNSNIRA